METLQQIVVQETTSENRRALAQYGEGLVPNTQKEIIYSDLTVEEKAIYDSFVSMIKSK